MASPGSRRRSCCSQADTPSAPPRCQASSAWAAYSRITTLAGSSSSTTCSPTVRNSQPLSTTVNTALRQSSSASFQNRE